MKKKKAADAQEEERQAWAKIPKRPQRNTEAEDHFDAAHVYACDEGIDADAVAHGLTRDEAEAGLVAQRLAKPVRAVVWYAAHGEGARQIARDHADEIDGKSKSWVAVQLKRSTIKRAIADVRTGKAQSIGNANQAPPNAKSGQSLDLHDLFTKAQNLFQSKPSESDERRGRADVDRRSREILGLVKLPPLRQYWGRLTSAERIAALICEDPGALVDNQTGPLLTRALADLLEAAQDGQCNGRVPGLVPAGKAHQRATVARKALQWLVSWPRGRPGPRLTPVEAVLAVHDFRERIEQLQAEWRGSARDADKIREAHSVELAFLSQKGLAGLLTSDPLDASARLAELATGISAEAFLRVWQSDSGKRLEKRWATVPSRRVPSSPA